MSHGSRSFVAVVAKGIAALFVAAVFVAIAELGIFQRARAGEATVAGTLTLGAEPARDMYMRFVLQGGRVFDEVVTDRRGQFELRRPGPLGEYGIIIGAMPHLHSTTRYLTVSGDTDATIALPPTQLNIRLVDERGNPVAAGTQLLVKGPSAPTQFQSLGFINSADKGEARFAGLGFGDYVITAFTPEGLVSASPARLALSPGRPRAELSLVLTRRILELQITDLLGRPLRNAQVRSGYKVLQENENGGYDVNAVPPGQEVLISVDNWLPTCRIAPGEDVRHEVIQLRPLGAMTARLNLVNAPERPVGLLEGLEGSQCPVPVEALPLRIVDGLPGQVTFDILGLSRGTLTYRAQEQAPPAILDVPGEPLLYVIPHTCRFC